MDWFILFLAGLAEVTWAIALKYADGFKNLVPSIITVIGYIASLLLLSAALKKLPLGTAYAVWTGIGIAGTSLLGVLLFKEKLSFLQFVCILLIVIGIVGLNLLSKQAS